VERAVVAFCVMLAVTALNGASANGQSIGDIVGAPGISGVRRCIYAYLIDD